MIESILTVLIGVLILWGVRRSRHEHRKMAKLSEDDLILYRQKSMQNPLMFWVVNGSLSNVPRWVFAIVILVIIAAVIFGASTIT